MKEPIVLSPQQWECMMPLSRFVGVYYPADLKILQRVFDQVCAERGIVLADDALAADRLAVQIVAFSGNGISGEAGLLRALNERKEHDSRRTG